ncbi:DUF2071 domain-containing protein [Sorangium sp. So ce429]
MHRDGEHPAVWFFSLDAAATIAVVLARLGWSLPYYRASMSMKVDGDEVKYRSRRWFAGDRPAGLEARCRIGAPLGVTLPGTFEHFLAERYLLISKRGDGFMLGQVHHRAYPLHTAEVMELTETMVVASGLPAPSGRRMCFIAPGWTWTSTRCGRFEARSVQQTGCRARGAVVK